MKLKILVIGQTSSIRKLVTKFLSEANHKIVGEAKDIFTGLDMYLQTQPDLVVLDIDTSSMDEVEPLQEALERFPSANILVISENIKIKRKALDIGAISFLRKPFQPAFLWRRIDNLIRKNYFSRDKPTKNRRCLDGQFKLENKNNQSENNKEKVNELLKSDKLREYIKKEVEKEVERKLGKKLKSKTENMTMKEVGEIGRRRDESNQNLSDCISLEKINLENPSSKKDSNKGDDVTINEKQDEGRKKELDINKTDNDTSTDLKVSIKPPRGRLGEPRKESTEDETSTEEIVINPELKDKNTQSSNTSLIDKIKNKIGL